MTSRERAINHHQPDHIPNGLGGCETAGLHAIAYQKLKKILGIPQRPPRIDTFMANAVFEMDAIREMGGDIILLASPKMCHADLRGAGVEAQWKDQKLWGRLMRVPSVEVFEEDSKGNIVWKTAGNIVCPPGSFFFDRDESLDNHRREFVEGNI